MKDLITVRKQLMKDGQNVYLASIEESCVSLVNFIHQADTMKYGNSANLENVFIKPMPFPGGMKIVNMTGT